MGQSQFDDDFLNGIQAVQPPVAAPVQKSPERRVQDSADPTLNSQASFASGAARGSSSKRSSGCMPSTVSSQCSCQTQSWPLCLLSPQPQA